MWKYNREELQCELHSGLRKETKAGDTVEDFFESKLYTFSQETQNKRLSLRKTMCPH